MSFRWSRGTHKLCLERRREGERERERERERLREKGERERGGERKMEKGIETERTRDGDGEDAL